MSTPTSTPPRVDDVAQVADLDTEYRWPDAMCATARQRMRHFAAAEVPDKHRAYYVTFTQDPAERPAEGDAGGSTDPTGDPAGGGVELTRDEGPEPVRAGRPLPGQSPGPVFTEPRHPLEFTPEALSAVQDAIDAHGSGRFVAADPHAQFAALTTATHGAPRAWGRNVLMGPRLLSAAARVPTQPVAAVLAQFPELTLPTAQPLAAEGTALVEYASSAAGSVTLGRFGRWTDMSRESLVGADAAAVTGMHRVGIALDLDKVLIDAVDAAAGLPVAFAADVPAQIRKAMAKVMANTAADDPADLVILAHPDDVHLLQDVQPTGGQTIAERFQRFSGALVYPSNSVATGFMIVANLRVGARYFTAVGLTTLTDTDIKTGVETVASFIIAGYGVTLTAGFAVKQDVVTP